MLATRGRVADAVELFDRAVPVVWRSRTLFVPGDVHECLQFGAAAYDAVARADDAERLRDLASSTSRRGIPGGS